MSSQTTITYHDKWLFMWVVPIANLINYYLTYKNIQLDTFFLLTFLIDTAEGYLALIIFRKIILYLDQKFPYHSNISLRLIIQGCVTAVAFLGTIISLTVIINFSATDKPIPLKFFTHDVFIFLIWVLVLNGIYISLYFYQSANNTNIPVSQEESEPKAVMDKLEVKLGKQVIFLDLKTILCFYVEEETVFVKTEDKRYVVDTSLDKLEELLSPELFFRANRQIILNRNLVAGITKAENGKLIVQLTESRGLPDQITISRTKAPAFKKWVQAAVPHLTT
ncbi:LytTR family DNA-binding domain-containing protein [Xanthocytophaga agilis]|uniref:LytTR family DNA-binding domain-containing protein n=1 Tax=Xanthocytophaga agilis TaxID=3048010 RepID=A0AAE3R1W8_9BACT|nr:LytTR family DNA-binding domain-containing protein [Xanthocytophaga agilis]MDJ1500089.1 LytTR family DNA-binding domain-containing protein [Xanthocytophaga agilis]